MFQLCKTGQGSTFICIKIVCKASVHHNTGPVFAHKHSAEHLLYSIIALSIQRQISQRYKIDFLDFSGWHCSKDFKNNVFIVGFRQGKKNQNQHNISEPKEQAFMPMSIYLRI